MKLRILLAVAATLAGTQVGNASPVYYDYTGTVTSTTGTYSGIAVGSTVTGVYTIDYANATATYSLGTVGTPGWRSQQQSGADYGTAPSSTYVFSSTESVGGTKIYSTGSAGAWHDFSRIGTSAAPIFYFSAEEQQQTSQGNGHDSQFSLGSPNGNVPVYDSSGTPILAAGATGAGEFYNFANGAVTGQVNFTITSLSLGSTPPSGVPLPAAAWLMLGSAGGLEFFGRKRKESPTAT